MSYAALTLLAAIVTRLPLAARVGLGRVLGILAGSVFRIRRALVEAAMARAGIDDPASVAAAMYRSLGEGLVELLWLAAAPAARREEVIARVSIDDASAAALDAACARGPVVLFASHTGNWELAAAGAARLLARSKRRLAVVAKPMHAAGVDVFLRRLRERCAIHVLSPRGALASARRSLDAGDVVVMPIDQVPDRACHGLPLPFLGELAVTDRAPATLAWRARATVLVVASERATLGEAGAVHRVRVLDVIEPPAEGDAASRWIAATTTRATSRLDAFVRGAPASWMWLHRRWRAPRAGRLPRLVATRQAG